MVKDKLPGMGGGAAADTTSQTTDGTMAEAGVGASGEDTLSSDAGASIPGKKFGLIEEDAGDTPAVVSELDAGSAETRPEEGDGTTKDTGLSVPLIGGSSGMATTDSGAPPADSAADLLPAGVDVPEVAAEGSMPEADTSTDQLTAPNGEDTALPYIVHLLGDVLCLACTRQPFCTYFRS